MQWRRAPLRTRGKATAGRFLLAGAIRVEDEEREVRHAGGETQAGRVGGGGCREIGQAAVVPASAWGAAMPRGTAWGEQGEGGGNDDIRVTCSTWGAADTHRHFLPRLS